MTVWDWEHTSPSITMASLLRRVLSSLGDMATTNHLQSPQLVSLNLYVRS
jgi:hypothetical protein